MLCKACGAPTRVLSTRTPDGEFMVVRRLACTGTPSHRFNTVEVLQTYFLKLGKSRREEYLRMNRAGAAIRRTAAQRRAKIAELHAAGKTYKEIARDVGVSYASVAKHVRALLADGTAARRKGQPPAANDWTAGFLPKGLK